MIKIQVELFSVLKKTVARKFRTKFKQGDNTVIFDNKITVEEMLKRLSIPENLEKIVLVNEKYRDPNYELKDGDIVKIFPPVAGG